MTNAGAISAEIAKQHAESEFEKYRVKQDRLFESDFDKFMLGMDTSKEQGYTAEKLASLSEYLDGEGTFDLLVELRENTEKGLVRISRGFKRK